MGNSLFVGQSVYFEAILAAKERRFGVVLGWQRRYLAEGFF